MPIEIYKDPETGEERRRWVAPKGMAAAAPPKPGAPAKAPAPAKPRGSGFDLGGTVNSLVKNTAQVLTNPAAAALPVMGLVKQATESPSTRGALESIGRTVTYGGRQLLQETNDFINDELAKTGLTQRTTAQKPDAPFLGIAPLPKVETQHPAEAIIGNILGYGAGFLLTRRAMGAVGGAAAPAAMRTPLAPVVQQAQKARAGVQALRNTPVPAAGQAGRTQALAKRATGFAIEEGATGAVAGAITTYAFQDPWSGNFSDLLKGTPLESPFSRFTQSNPNDKAEEARLKNAATDFVYGIPLGIGIGAAGAAVKAATVKVITKTAKLAATVDNVAVKEAQADLAETVADVTPPAPPVKRITGRQPRATEVYADMRREPLWEQKGVEIQERLDTEGRVEPTMTPEVQTPPGAAPMDDPWGEPTVAQARKELEDAQFELQNEVAKETYSTPEPMPLAEGQIPELAPPAFDELATLPPSSIQVDPRRFQFKAEGQTKTGQSGSLSDTEAYNPDLANVISVWRDPADGQVYVVNGHNRLARANRSGAPGINVRFIEAADAAEARTKGAMQNISEEKGTPVDAAKVMRDSGMGPAEMVQAGVSPSSRVMADAAPLTRLPQNLFDNVAIGKLDLAKAIALGSVEGLDDQVVNDVAAEAAKRKWSAAKIEQAMQEAKFATTTVDDDPGDLLKILGDEWATKTSNFNQLLDIRTEAFSKLREEMVALTSAANAKRTGYLEAAGNVINVAGSQAARGQATQAVEVFNRVTGYVGPVRDLLNEMAGQIKGKVTAKQVVADNLERLRTAIQEEINGPRLPMEDAAAPVARAADEVTAPAAEVAAPTATVKRIEETKGLLLSPAKLKTRLAYEEKYLANQAEVQQYLDDMPGSNSGKELSEKEFLAKYGADESTHPKLMDGRSVMPKQLKELEAHRWAERTLAEAGTTPSPTASAPAPRQLSPEDRAQLDQALKVLPKAKREEVIAQLESGEPLGNPTPIGEPPILQAAEPFTLPAELQRSAPRYSYGSKQFQLEFASDLDKTAYILANDVKTVSKAAPKFRAAVEAAGLDLEEIAAHGDQVRAAIKQQARDAEPGVIRLPDQGFSGAELSVELPGWTQIEGMPRLGEGFSGRTTLRPGEQAAIEEVAARVAGMTPDQVRIVDSIPVELDARQAASWGYEPGTRVDAVGMYYPGNSAADDLLTVAMLVRGQPESFIKRIETAHHEAFHRVQSRYLTDQERRTLQAGEKQIRELAARVSPGHADKLLDGSISRKEAEAVAFQGWWRYADEYEKATWAQPFKKLQQIVDAVGNWLLGRGYQTWDDVFERSFQGEIAERGYRPEFVEPQPTIQLAIQPPDPEDFAKRINDNIDAMRNGDMDLQEAMSGDVRRYISRSGQTIYRPSAPEEMIATNKALSDMLASRAEATGIASYNVEEIYQQAARRLAKDGLHVETTVKRLESARAGDPRSQEDLISHAAVILHRDEVANQNGIAAIEFQNATDEASKADAMRRLWAGYEDQIKLDTALMTATRKDAQRLRLNQGPERKTFVNARQLPEGTILRHGTYEEAGQAILTDGFQPSQSAVGILGEGVYFTTKDTLAGAYGDVEVYGDMPGDIRIFDLFAMDKSMSEFLKDLDLGGLDRGGLISQRQKDAIRQWATDNGYDGIRYEADFGSKPNKSGVDEIIIYDANNANRVVGSDAAVPPTPDLPDETVQEIVDKELQDPANSLLEKLDPEIRADIEEGVLGPDAEELTDTLARVAITSRDVKGFASKFGAMAKEVPTGKLNQDLVLQMYRSSLLWSMKTWMKMTLGSAYRTTTLPAAQAFGALTDAARQGASGNAQGAANALRRAGLDMGMYLQYMARLPHAMRLAGHAFKEGESFGNLGRSQMEVAQKGFSEVDQMALDAPEFMQQGPRENTLDNPYFLNPESKNMVALATRALWKAANLSGRVAGSLDTFYSSLVGPSAEWARLMDLQLRQADDLGMEPGKAWQWASDKTDELLDAQWAKVVLSDGKTIENGALTGRHAQTVMDWVNFTDPLDIKYQDRSFEYGIRKAKDEGLTDSTEISTRALEWTKETPDAWQKAGMGAAKVVSLAPKLYQDAVNQVPILGMIQAFNRGPTNITKAAMRASGFASPLVDTFWRDINSEDAFTRDRAIGEIAVGWLTAVSAVTLATSGYVELTGPGSYSPQVRQKMKMDGHRPFAIRFRNPWTNEWSGYWDLTPYDSVATVFAGVATYMNAANNIPAENREALANNLVLTIAESIRQVGAGQFSKGMYGGISDIFEMLSDLESGNFIPVKNQIGSFDAYIQKKLTGFMPAVFRNVRRGQDPYERVIPTGDWPYPFNGFQELGYRFMNEIPGLSENLPPNLHPLTANPIPVEQVWGTNFVPPDQPWLRGLVQAASPTAGMPYTMGSTDPVDNELRRLSGRGTAFIIWNTNEFQLPNYRLSIQQLNRIKEITRDYVPPGRTTSLHGSLTALVTSPEYLALPTPEPSRATESARAIQVNQEINYYKQYIKNEFRAEDPEVDQLLQKIERTKIMNQNDAQIGVEAWTQRMTR